MLKQKLLPIFVLIILITGVFASTTSADDGRTITLVLTRFDFKSSATNEGLCGIVDPYAVFNIEGLKDTTNVLDSTPEAEPFWQFSRRNITIRWVNVSIELWDEDGITCMGDDLFARASFLIDAETGNWSGDGVDQDDEYCLENSDVTMCWDVIVSGVDMTGDSTQYRSETFYECLDRNEEHTFTTMTPHRDYATIVEVQPDTRSSNPLTEASISVSRRTENSIVPLMSDEDLNGRVRFGYHDRATAVYIRGRDGDSGCYIITISWERD